MATTSTPAVLPSPPAMNRKPLVLYAVIDNSGSMGLSCGEAKGTESDGYSRLDLVKHTLNTIIMSLSDEDQVCIVKFSSSASVFVPPTKMTEKNQKAVAQKLKELEPEDSTNIWDGVKVALDGIASLGTKELAGKNVQIYLLTDGEPNIHPPKPMPQMTTEYLKTHCPEIRPVVSTFGYGYKLDSEMLLAVAQVGNGGAFGFIPDSSMVGTVFINALSNSLLVGAASDGSREALVSDPVISSTANEFVNTLKAVLGNRPEAAKYEELAKFIGLVRQTIAALNPSSPQYTKQKELLDGLLLDCVATEDVNNGQIHKALQTAFFNSWGRHYLRSVLSAYDRRICINFKDDGMQAFKTDRFAEEQQRIEEVFVQLPPPVPSKPQFDDSGSGTYAAAPTTMAGYYNRSGGCFTGSSLVLGPAGNSMAVNKLVKGSVVLSNAGYTTVEVVVQIKYSGPLYVVGESMALTAYHPVMINSESFFPVELYENGSAKVQHIASFDGYVYDVVLQNRGILACPLGANENELLYVATFGHQVPTKIFKHAYFGDEAIVNDLKKHPDWIDGFIVLDEPQFIRDVVTQQIIELAF